VIAATQCGELSSTLDELLLGEFGNPATSSQARISFSLSLLRDIVRAGGNSWVRDSRLYVAWPDWSGVQGRDFARQALVAAKDLRPLTIRERERVAPLFAPDLDGESLSSVLREGRFRLISAATRHPSGISYQDAFAAALRYWTMPYRGRSGRMKRFVLTAEHHLLGEHSVVAGILELGDEAPFCTWRDDLLGISPSSFVRWLAGKDISAIRQSAERLRNFRHCLRGTGGGQELAYEDAAAIVARREVIEQAAHGRSRVLKEQHDALKDRKRLAYGLRLARGEFALREIALGKRKLDSQDADLGAGVRGLHDMLLPRLHLEATVCGAVPPFSHALGGKLLVSFLSHPSVIDATMDCEGALLDWSFDSDRLKDLLPSKGMLCLTTKGLYAEHAAIYNRGDVPGLLRSIRMVHLDNTSGTTTTLISAQTHQYAKQMLHDDDSSAMRVSDVYGSGGAKRHRVIEKATIDVGLPARLAMAGIRRPVYGLNYVSNAPAVSWLGEEPCWLVDRQESIDEFSERATDLWRQRWLSRAIDRIADFALVPSLIRTLEAQSLEAA